MGGGENADKKTRSICLASIIMSGQDSGSRSLDALAHTPLNRAGGGPVMRSHFPPPEWLFAHPVHRHPPPGAAVAADARRTAKLAAEMPVQFQAPLLA